MKIPLLRLPYTSEEIDYIKNEIETVLKSGFLTMSKKVEEFERLFAHFCGTEYALGTNSGTSALEIALRTIGVREGNVVMPSNTYMATPLAAIKAGARVLFTECQVENLQMDPEDLKKKINKDTKAVILVHIGGIISSYFEDIKEICGKHNIPLIEDAAHAHGAEFKGMRAGKLGKCASFSFYPTKVLTTAEGGMLTTDDKKIYEAGLVFREHGKADHGFNIHTEIGDNWRFSELHAVLGIQQMKKADYILSERRRLAKLYDDLLSDNKNIKLINIPVNIKSSYYKYIAYIPEDFSRDIVKKEMKEKYDIMLPGEVYSKPCHSQPVFKKYPDLILNSPEENFSQTDYVCKRHICLPLYPGLKDEEVEYVTNSLKKVLA